MLSEDHRYLTNKAAYYEVQWTLVNALRISRLNLDQLNTLSGGQRNPKCTLAASTNQAVGRFFIIM